MAIKKYEFIEHTADIKFRAYGDNVENVFENSLLAFSEILSRGKKVKSLKKKSFEVKGKDYEELMYNFLEEMLYFLDAEDFIPSMAKVRIFENDLKQLKVEVFGDDVSNYKDLDHIKAITYAEMHIKDLGIGKGWEGQVVVDV